MGEKNEPQCESEDKNQQEKQKNSTFTLLAHVIKRECNAFGAFSDSTEITVERFFK